MPLVTTTYDLQGQLDHSPLHVTYTSFVRTAAPVGHFEPNFLPADRVHVVHGSTDFAFAGDQITVVETAVGRLVTLELFVVPDLGTTTLAILLPDVAFPVVAADDTAATDTTERLHTTGLQALRKSSFAPQLDHGQLQSYSVVHLHGHVSRVTGTDAPVALASQGRPAAHDGATASA